MTDNGSVVSIIGFGEAGASLCLGWNRRCVRGFDIKLKRAQTREAILAAMKKLSVNATKDAATAVRNADLIFSTVTADQAFSAASSVVPGLKPGALFFDLNSCAPTTKLESEAVIEAAGGRYVDVAVMATITPHYHKTPMLICGKHSDDAMTALQALDMKPTLVPGPVGRASTIKMLRSVLMKGVEALTFECFFAASKAGVINEVANSLDASQTKLGWKDQASYNCERMTTHGIRRAAEMREVVKTLSSLGISAEMTRGTVKRQQELGQLKVSLNDFDGCDARIAALEQALSKS